jgi:hypothetical protein
MQSVSVSEESIATAVGFRDEPTDTGGVDTGLYGAASATMLIGYSLHLRYATW